MPCGVRTHDAIVRAIKARAPDRADTVTSNLYYLQNIIMVIKSISMRWAKHVVHMREVRSAYILVGKPH
jgi:hypothetical protein